MFSQRTNIRVYILIVLSVNVHSFSIGDQQCDTTHCDRFEHNANENLYRENFNLDYHHDNKTRFLLYDVNLSEGFNLRRDVYIRMASLIKKLGPNWVLVLPQWIDLPHWEINTDEEREFSKKWSTYFDMDSMNRFVKLMEMNDFLNQSLSSKISVDTVLSLEHLDTYDNDFRESYEIIQTNRTRYYMMHNRQIYNLYDPSLNSFFDYKSLYEVKIEGFDRTLFDLIRNNFTTSEIVLISNAEIVLHSSYGDKSYWMARRSMRFANKLRHKGDEFRKSYLNSDDLNDGTVLADDWRLMRRAEGDAQGGPFLAVHLRRKDFVRTNRVPNLDCAVHQIHFAASNLIDKHIENIYIATDADDTEFDDLKHQLESKGHRIFNFGTDHKEKLSPGELAVVDQYISSHAEIFVGTLESTFSYQIQEEREILGFRTNTTFNALCAKCDLRLMLKLCKQESAWKIVY